MYLYLINTIQINYVPLKVAHMQVYIKEKQMLLIRTFNFCNNKMYVSVRSQSAATFSPRCSHVCANAPHPPPPGPLGNEFQSHNNHTLAQNHSCPSYSSHVQKSPNAEFPAVSGTVGMRTEVDAVENG